MKGGGGGGSEGWSEGERVRVCGYPECAHITLGRNEVEVRGGERGRGSEGWSEGGMRGEGWSEEERDGVRKREME